MSKILITGGAGFIGSHLVKQLSSAGNTITILDSLSSQVHGSYPKSTSPLLSNIPGNVTFIHGSVNNKSDLTRALVDNQIVIHLAAETGVGQSMKQIQKYTEINIQGTSTLLDTLVNCENQIEKVIIGSSRAVYGEGKYYNESTGIVFPDFRSLSSLERGLFDLIDTKNNTPLISLPTDESSPLNPISVYGITKLNQEQLVKYICESIGIKYSILRYQNVFGPGQSINNPHTGILPLFFKQALLGETINIYEDGKSTRDFIYINDVIEATSRCLSNKETDNKTINIGTGKSKTILEVGENVYSKLGIPPKVRITGKYRFGDIRHSRADVSRLKNILHFIPKTTFDIGMDDYIEMIEKDLIFMNQL